VRLVAVLLIVGGILALIYGGFTYVKDRDTAEVGPVRFSVEKREHVDIPPIAGAAALAGGIALLLVGTRSRSV
jgi:hypothetical protein